MGYIQDARENHVKKKVEEGITYFLLRPQILNPKRTDYKKCWKLWFLMKKREPFQLIVGLIEMDNSHTYPRWGHG